MLSQRSLAGVCGERVEEILRYRPIRYVAVGPQTPFTRRRNELPLGAFALPRAAQDLLKQSCFRIEVGGKGSCLADGIQDR